MKYKMYYVSGGGSQYDGGIWEISETPRAVTFVCVEEPFFDLNIPTKMKIRREKERRHCLWDWGDGTFTVYPNQSGVPHVFEPLQETSVAG